MGMITHVLQSDLNCDYTNQTAKIASSALCTRTKAYIPVLYLAPSQVQDIWQHQGQWEKVIFHQLHPLLDPLMLKVCYSPHTGPLGPVNNNDK